MRERERDERDIHRAFYLFKEIVMNSIASLRSPALLRVQARIAKSSRNVAACATHKVTVLPGDGIGPEIMDVAIDVLKAAGQKEGAAFEFTEALIGGAAVDAANDPYPADTEAACKASDAVLLAAIGGYKWDDLPYECVRLMMAMLMALVCSRPVDVRAFVFSCPFVYPCVCLETDVGAFD